MAMRMSILLTSGDDFAMSLKTTEAYDDKFTVSSANEKIVVIWLRGPPGKDVMDKNEYKSVLCEAHMTTNLRY